MFSAVPARMEDAKAETGPLYHQALSDLDALSAALIAANRQIEALTQELHERENGEGETTSRRLSELQAQARLTAAPCVRASPRTNWWSRSNGFRAAAVLLTTTSRRAWPQRRSRNGHVDMRAASRDVSNISAVHPAGAVD